MPSYQRPGVYVQETLNPIQPVVGPSSTSVGAFFGTSDRGPTTPTLITSWSQYVNKFGGFNTTASNNLPIAAYMFFANGGNVAYFCRVTGTGDVAATRTLTDRAATPVNTLSVSAINTGTWGNNINISVTDSTVTGYFNLIVYYGGSTSAYIVEQWTDLSMVNTDSRFASNVINGNSAYIVVADLASGTTAPGDNPAVITNQSLSTGANGASVSGSDIVTKLTSLDTIEQSLVLNIPGYTDATTINGAISYATGRGDVFVVVDSPNTTVSSALSLAATYTASSQAAVYYPALVIADPTATVGSPTGATKTVPSGAAVVGLYAATDASRGVFKAPAGIQARLAGVVSVASLSNADLDSLNSAAAPINAIKYIPGSGIVVYGARTLKAGYVDRYVPVRRTLIYLEKSLKDLTRFAVFEPNDQRLWTRLDATISSFLTSFWSQGGLFGTTPSQAYFVKVDADNNPQASIDNGIVNIQVGVALQRPAEFVVISIGQYSGGTTVTVA